MISGTPFQITDIDAEWWRIAHMVIGVDPRDNAGDDLRQRCREGLALCLTSADGLLVISLQPDRYGSGELELFVHMACADGERGSIQRNDVHLDAIARELGATRLVFQTIRPGMHKVLNPEWRVRHTTFERDVHGHEIGTGAGNGATESAR